MDPEKKAALVSNGAFVAMLLLLAGMLIGASYLGKIMPPAGTRIEVEPPPAPAPSRERNHLLKPYSLALFAPEQLDFRCLATYSDRFAQITPGTRIMVLEDPGDDRGADRTIKFKVDEGALTGWMGEVPRRQITPQP